jgi:hypothetical protein
MLLDIYKINDNRDSFKKVSISNYKITELIKLYTNNLINSNLDYSANLLIELHCSGYIHKIIQIFIKVYLQNINIKNPYLLQYLMKKIMYLNKLLNNYKKKDYIITRNEQEIRNLLIECNGIITNSPKSNILQSKYLPKVKEDDYNSFIIKKNLQTTNFDYLELIDFNHPQNNYLKIALNEIFYLLYYKKNLQKIYFWYFWVKKHCNINDLFNYLLKIIYFKLDNLDIIKKKYILFLLSHFQNKMFNNLLKENILFIIFYIFLNEIDFYKNIIIKEHLILEMSLKVNYYYKDLNDKLNPIYKIDNFYDNNQIKNNQIKNNQIKNNQIKNNQIKNNQIKNNQIKNKDKKIKNKDKQINEKERYKLEIYNKLFL